MLSRNDKEFLIIFNFIYFIIFLKKLQTENYIYKDIVQIFNSH